MVSSKGWKSGTLGKRDIHERMPLAFWSERSGEKRPRLRYAAEEQYEYTIYEKIVCLTNRGTKHTLRSGLVLRALIARIYSSRHFISVHDRPQ